MASALAAAVDADGLRLATVLVAENERENDWVYMQTDEVPRVSFWRVSAACFIGSQDSFVDVGGFVVIGGVNEILAGSGADSFARVLAQRALM